MRREVLEETGLDLSDADVEPHYLAMHLLNTVSVFRIFRFPMSAEAIVEHVARHVAGDPDPEITDAVTIRNADPDAHDYAFFMLPILKWLFDKQEHDHVPRLCDL
jgi:8-oxo-dGTP pyrophosphatase MutT (NUDIX family)